ncbi:MAG: hypothetical protein VKP57_02665 [Candidatus Sericytochromatia bacterium]|nr:hypothetical protein [Candidatus Sericytochromatia bacterium]
MNQAAAGAGLDDAAAPHLVIRHVHPGTPPERVAAALASISALLAEEQAQATGQATGTWKDKSPWVRAALLESVSGGDLRWRPGPWTWGT